MYPGPAGSTKEPLTGSPSPPTTTTFLFTDIEGSTRRWEERPEMVDTIDAHFAVLRAAVAEAGGEVFATMGDGIAAAFRSADAAVLAAVDAQRRLRSLGLRVRMGMHTGEAERRDDDYRGRTVNRAARIMAAGHGGQVLLSDVTAALARAGSGAVELVDLGSHRLRDLADPEHLWQLVAADLDRSFPPLRTVRAAVGGLPAPRTSLVGREDDVRRVATLLRDRRLVTLTGVGGVGKTRLAVEAAAEQLGRGVPVWFVDLAAVADPADVPEAVARTLGVASAPDPLAASAATIADERSVLLVDNCEHVVDAAADVVDALTEACPKLTVLATSREGLGVDGEHIVVVRPLPAESAGVELFRARAAAAGASLDQVDPAGIEQVCRRLDGIPLAIELAAARMATLDLSAISGGLDDRAGRRRGDGDRHGTMRTTIRWSHRLLVAEERRLLHWLSVFPAGFELDAVVAVAAAAGIDRDVAVDHIGSLVHKSMVVAEHGDDGLRYRLLEVVRDFLLERLDDEGEREAAITALARWVTDLTDLPAHEPCTATVERHAVRLEREADAWREAALHAARTGSAALAAALCGPPTAFFLLGRHDLAEVVRPLLAAAGDDAVRRRAVLCALIVANAGTTDPVEVQAWADEVALTDLLLPTGLGGLMRWVALAWRGDFAASVELCVAASCDTSLSDATRDLFVGIAVLDHHSLTGSTDDRHGLLQRALDVAARSDVSLTRATCLLGAAWGLRDTDPRRAVQLVERALDDARRAPALTRLTLPGSASRLLAQLDPTFAARGLLDQLERTSARPSSTDLIPLLYGAAVLARVDHPAAEAVNATLTLPDATPFLSMMDVVDRARRATSVVSRNALAELESVIRDALADLAVGSAAGDPCPTAQA